MSRIAHSVSMNGGVNSDSVNINCTGAGVLLLWLYHEGVTLSTLTVGGSSAGISNLITSVDGNCSLHALPAPPAGSQACAYTLSGVAGRCGIRAAAFDNYSALRTALRVFADPGPVSGNAVSEVGDLVVSFGSCGGATLTAGSGQGNALYDLDWLSAGRSCGIADKAGSAGTTAVSWSTATGDNMNMLAVAIVPAPPAGVPVAWLRA